MSHDFPHPEEKVPALYTSCAYCIKPALVHVCAEHESSHTLKEASQVILNQAQEIATLRTELSTFRNPLEPPF
jgi:hypothetical protein